VQEDSGNRGITWRDFERLERKVDVLAERVSKLATKEEVDSLRSEHDRFVVVVLGIFGTLTIFGLGTAVTLLTSGAA